MTNQAGDLRPPFSLEEKMHFCTAKIAIGGDIGNTMVRDTFNPVSWPELEVLNVIHGEGAVTDVEPFVQVPQPPKVERERLVSIYGPGPVGYVWGGTRSPHEMDSPNGPVKPGTIWLNPITNRAEKVPEHELAAPAKK
jgi:hypothetical protein